MLEIKKNTATLNQSMWDNLEGLEEKIKKAANKKFQALKEVLKTELRADILEEILEELRSTFAPNTEEIKEGLATIKDSLLKEVKHSQASALAEIEHERLIDKALAARRPPQETKGPFTLVRKGTWR